MVFQNGIWLQVSTQQTLAVVANSFVSCWYFRTEENSLGLGWTNLQTSECSWWRPKEWRCWEPSEVWVWRLWPWKWELLNPWGWFPQHWEGKGCWPVDPHSCWGWDPLQVAGSFSWGCWWTWSQGILLRPLGELAIVGQRSWPSLPQEHTFLPGGEECQQWQRVNVPPPEKEESSPVFIWFRKMISIRFSLRLQLGFKSKLVWLIPKPRSCYPHCPLKTCVPRGSTGSVFLGGD